MPFAISRSCCLSQAYETVSSRVKLSLVVPPHVPLTSISRMSRMSRVVSWRSVLVSPGAGCPWWSRRLHAVGAAVLPPSDLFGRLGRADDALSIAIHLTELCDRGLTWRGERREESLCLCDLGSDRLDV